MNWSPTSYASTGLWRWTLGRPGIAPSSTSSILGCSAAVMETESPSQPSPAVIHKMWTLVGADDFISFFAEVDFPDMALPSIYFAESRAHFRSVFPIFLCQPLSDAIGNLQSCLAIYLSSPTRRRNPRRANRSVHDTPAQAFQTTYPRMTAIRIAVVQRCALSKFGAATATRPSICLLGRLLSIAPSYLSSAPLAAIASGAFSTRNSALQKRIDRAKCPPVQRVPAIYARRTPAVNCHEEKIRPARPNHLWPRPGVRPMIVRSQEAALLWSEIFDLDVIWL